MKTIIIASSIAIASLGLVACSSDNAPAPTVTVTQQVPVPNQDDPPTPKVEVNSEELYLSAIKSMDNPILNVATDRQLLDMGYSVCDALSAGFTVDDVVAYMAREIAKDGGASETYVAAVGYIIGAADMALCPAASF
jgi:hypothetical protein